MFGREKREFLLREIEENEKRIALTLFIEISVSQWIERYRELLRIKIFKMSCRGAVEDLTKGVHNKVTSMDREVIEHIETSLIDRVAVE